jgi:uncharacterized protein (TIGR02145 family)
MNAQIGIGTTEPDPSAVLDVSAEELPANAKKGFLPPRLTTDQRDAIASPAEGLTIFNTDNGCLEFYNGALWVNACDGSLQPGPVSDCSTPGFIAPYITADETEVVDITITTPNGSQTWMDRNLGAITAARASDDCYAYGNLHQWGRGSDGHENRNSGTASGPVIAGNEGSNFITTNSFPDDWLSNQDDSRWGDPTDTDKNTLYDPCPAGYRVPSFSEIQDLDASFSPNNAAGAFASIKLPLAGERSSGGGLLDVGQEAYIWTSTRASGNLAAYLFITGSNSQFNSRNRSVGQSVRCIKD